MNVSRKLSQTQGALKKGYTADNAYESFPIIQTMADVEAASNTAVLASTALTAAAVTVSGASVSDPNEYRAVRITGNQVSVAGTVVITGRDRGGRIVTDRIAAAGASTVDGVIPMAAVVTVLLPVLVAAGDEISVGVSEKLGLYRPIETTADVVMMERKATAADEFTVESNTGTVSATYATVTPSGGIVADDSFKFSFNTKQF